MATAKKMPSGRWRIRVYVGNDEYGRPVYKSITADTKREAEYSAATFLLKNSVNASSMSVGEAVDRYINSKSNILSPSTLDGYKKIRRNHIKRIERIRLDDLTREIVQKWVNQEASIVSPKTVANIYGLLNAAVTMYRPDFIINIRLPRKVKQLKRDLPTSDVVIKAVRGTPIELPVLLALWLCLRLSEVRGIKKSAIHGDTLYIENVIVTVGKENVEKEIAKTDSSRRIVRLPNKLKKMILDQEGEYVTTLSGKAIYSRFTRLLAKAGYPHVRFHDLRHIAASDMNRLGITDRVAADRGGWSTTATMRNVYQHSFSSDRDHAEDVIQEYYSKMMEDLEEPETTS